ncbi:MAG: polyprenyl diphosphate synthase [Gammaproteobacteria bacterium]|nr:polyprenyl diphosphate synthase [Gammaproteobacteria bacterium]MDD9863482.1 polyprenyl diphosphate synthase [Gammaproteobacteria bacterium]
MSYSSLHRFAPAVASGGLGELQHLVFIMDGNGRWARRRGLPRVAGHRAGVETLRRMVRLVLATPVRALTVFAFSSENWHRPRGEVRRLLELFRESLQRELSELCDRGIRLRFIGGREPFPAALRRSMAEAERNTRDNDRLQLTVAVNYGGRWDIAQACRKLSQQALAGRLSLAEIDESLIAGQLSLADLPDPDLLIRTGGEQRISNYLLWQMAYTELYFTDRLWPDFAAADLESALSWYAGRQRRFGGLDAPERERERECSGA